MVSFNPGKVDRQYPISTEHLNWIDDLCQRGNVDAVKLFAECGITPAMRNSPAGYLSWTLYANLVSAVAKLLEDDELRQAGQLSWQAAGEPKTLASVGRVLFRPVDQYLAMYGPVGYCCTEYPLESRVRQLSDTSMTIEMRMNHGARYCYPLFTYFAGQMEALTRELGFTEASVTMKPIDTGAMFTVHHSVPGQLTHRIRQLTAWFFSSIPITSELAQLTAMYRQLRRQNRDTHFDHVQAANQLAAEEKNLRLIAGNIMDAIWAFDVYGDITWSSPSAASLLGHSAEEMRNLPLEVLFGSAAGEELAALLESLQDAGPGATRKLDELEVVRPGKRSIWLNLRMIRRAASVRGAIVCVANDISERKHIQSELAERTTSHKAITDSALDAIITFDSELRISYANPATMDIFGYPMGDLLDMRLEELMPASLNGGDLHRLYHFGTVDSGAGISARGLRRDKSIVPLEASFASHDRLRTCIIRDVTARLVEERERRTLRSQLEASQKLDTVGQLSGGIAHDFNNLLVAILGYADLALQSERKDQQQTYLKEIKRAGEMGADMTRKLLSFSRRGAINLKLVSARALITDIQPMIRRLLPSDISVHFERGVDEAYLHADAVQIEQVLVNLAVNARDAMPAGGEFHVRLLPASQVRTTSGGSSRQLCIEVTDTGTGMSEEVRERIFEPLYTTKTEGKGTGLGMAVVFSIISQHQGLVEVQSTVGEGTTIRLYLPTTDIRPANGNEVLNQPGPAGAETILIVEDNKQVRDLANLILTNAGYRVLEAEDGLTGVAQYQAHRDAIDLVLMDIVMPRLSGRDAADRILRYDPGANIVFTSGYLDDSPHTRFIAEKNLPLIAKPFGTAALRSQVRTALDHHIVQHQARYRH